MNHSCFQRKLYKLADTFWWKQKIETVKEKKRVVTAPSPKLGFRAPRTVKMKLRMQNVSGISEVISQPGASCGPLPPSARKQKNHTVNWKINHCERTEKRNIDKTRESTFKSSQYFLFFAHHTFLKTIAYPHCTHCQSPTSQFKNPSFVKESNFCLSN